MRRIETLDSVLYLKIYAFIYPPLFKITNQLGAVNIILEEVEDEGEDEGEGEELSFAIVLLMAKKWLCYSCAMWV